MLAATSVNELTRIVLCGGGRHTLGAAESIAQAWRLLYAALHILDSVEDEDVADEPWTEWGTGAAINLSTGLIAGTGSLLCTLEQAGIPPDAAQDIRYHFFQTLLRMTSGQHADLTLPQPTLEQCWQIADAKSGAWFALACWSGARMVTADATQLECFRQFGYHLGMLLQIGDDLHGLWPKPGTHSDLVNWPRWTLPVAYATTVLQGAERDRLHACLRAAATNAAAENEAREITIQAGAVLYLTVEAQQHYHVAHHVLLNAAEEAAARDELLTLLRAHLPFDKP